MGEKYFLARLTEVGKSTLDVEDWHMRGGIQFREKMKVLLTQLFYFS